MNTEHRYHLTKGRANSRSLDLTKCSDSPEVESVVDHLYAVMGSAQLTPKQRTHQIKLRDHLKVILLDLYVVYRSDPSRYLAYSRDPKAYNKSSSRYHSVSNRYGFRNIVKAVDFLIDRNLIENVEGYEDLRIPGKSFLSRMRATPELIKLTREDFGVLLPMIKHDTGDETIILKAPKPQRDWKRGRSGPRPKAKVIDYDDTSATIRMRDNLRIINKQLEQTSILLDISDEELVRLHKQIRDERDSNIADDQKRELIDFSWKRLRRIFNNGSFEQGGSYGGWW